jgi:hypothetical protein
MNYDWMNFAQFPLLNNEILSLDVGGLSSLC